MTEASLNIAERLAARHKVNNVRLEQRNLLDLELADTFDIVVSSGVIHHLEDPLRGLKNRVFVKSCG
jgi:2-polyprenyl-3-methyl-5-hydroxy-6-metoxy-1,4-benzoquinol methylase